MQFNCPKCQTLLTANATNAGQVVECPSCKTKLKLPGRSAQATPRPPAKPSPPVPVSPPPTGLPPMAQDPFSPSSSNVSTGNQNRGYYQPRRSKTQRGLWIWISLACAAIGVLLIGGIGIAIYWSTQSDAPTKTASNDNRATEPSPSSQTNALDRPTQESTPATDKQTSPIFSGPLAYSMQPNTDYHYTYRVLLDLEKESSLWKGSLSFRKASNVAAERMDDGSWLLASETGQGVAIAPNIIMTSHELVAQASDISVTVGGVTTRAEVIGFEPSLSDLQSGVAILRTDKAVTDQFCFNARYKFSDTRRPASIVYRTETGETSVQPIKIQSFNGSKNLTFATCDANASTSPTPDMHGGLVVTDKGIMGIVGHVPDTNFGHFAIIGLSNLGNLFQRYRIQVSETSPPTSDDIGHLAGKYGESTVRVRVGRPPNPDGVERLLVTNRMFASEPAGNKRLPGLKHSKNIVQKGAALIEPNGLTHSAVNLVELPVALGSPCNLMMIPLEGSQNDSWRVRIPVAFMEEVKDARYHHHVRHNYYRSPTEKVYQQTDASLMIRNFEITDRTESAVIIKETMSINLDNTYSIHGTGEYEFDPQQGMMKSGKFDGKLVVKTTNIEVRIPYNFEFATTTAAEIAERERTLKEAQAKAREKRSEEMAVKKRPLSPDELEQYLERLRSRSGKQRAVFELRSREIYQPHPEISAELLQMARDFRGMPTYAEAAMNFMVAEDARVIFEELDLMPSESKWYPVFARSNLVDAIPYLMEKTLSHNHEAHEALAQYPHNPEIEIMVLDAFMQAQRGEREFHHYVADDLFQVLGQHGTQRSLDMFDQTARNSNQQPSMAAKSAYRKIANRLQQSSSSSENSPE